MRKAAAILGLFFLLGAGNGPVFHIERPSAGGAASLEKRVENGTGTVWVLERRSYSRRGQTKLDGVILVEPNSPLKLTAIRRSDGDHRFVLGSEGKAGDPAGTLKERIKEFRRERLWERRIAVKGNPEPLAFLYVPTGASVRVYSDKGEPVVEVQLPWEAEDGLSLRNARGQNDPFQNLGDELAR